MISKINPSSRVPIYQQLIDQVAFRIAVGELPADEQLPSIRSLSSTLHINPNTVIKAYRELEYLGYAYSKHGMGYYIAKQGVAAAREKWQTRIMDELRQVATRALALGMSRELILSTIARTVDKGA